MNIEFSFNTANTITAASVSGKSVLLPYDESSLISQGIATTGLKPTPPPPPNGVPAGTLISTECRGIDKWGTYADGGGGFTYAVIQYNSPECGLPNPQTNYVGTLTSDPSSFTLISASNGYLMNDLPSANEIVNFIPV